ncbi:MAG: PAS domain-containing protein [Desulfobacter sp.]|nr:MAG: PAS domain-containing protein [Desulfobacter sp.]
MVPDLSEYFKRIFFSNRQYSLYQWQEKSFIFVFGAVCIAALPALVNSSLAAVKDEMWVNLVAYNAAYLLCIILTFFKKIPFKPRAWTGVLVFLALGFLSIYSVGPTGSGRIWLFSTTIFTTLILGTRAGIVILMLQALGLSLFYFYLKTDFVYWANLGAYSPRVWITTSITLMFLSIVSMVAMARVIRSISLSLDASKQAESRLKETTRQLYHRVKEHNQTILSLRESEKRWHFALEGAGDGVWDWAVEANKIYFSNQWKKMLGYAQNEIGDGPEEWFDRIHPDERHNIRKTIEQYIRRKVPYFKNRYRLRCKDGTYKWILDRGRVMDWDDNGAPVRIIGTHADITMIKELEDQKTEYKSRLQQAQKMEAIGTLAGGIAHDFNNILFPILGHSEILLADGGLKNKDAMNSLGQIHSSALRAKELVQQILTFSRQESTEYRPVKVQFVLKEVVKLLRSTIPRTIEIKQFVDMDCRTILADAIQIHQIIMNLATNAYHAMDEQGGELKIYLANRDIEPADARPLGIRPGPAVCLAVADTGMGMAPDLVKKIFDPFFTTKEKGQGTGMGLSVVHGIVKNMKGCINVYSEPGKGTEFKIYFPAEASAEINDGLNKKPDIGVLMGKEHILLVDDEQSILDLEQQSLERLGYTVDAVDSPMDALTHFSAAPNAYDLVITDMAMPGMPGSELTAKLLDVRRDIPVLLCTGFSEKMTPEMVRQLGIREVIMKPVLMRELSAAIRRVLDGAPGTDFIHADLSGNEKVRNKVSF